MDLRKLIDRGEKLLSGSYGILDAYNEYEYLKRDILQYFMDLQNEIADNLQSPENLEEVLKDLRAFLPPDDTKSE